VAIRRDAHRHWAGRRQQHQQQQWWQQQQRRGRWQGQQWRWRKQPWRWPQDPAILGQIGEFLEVCRLRAELGPTAVINWLNKDFEMGRPYDILVEYPITP